MTRKYQPCEIVRVHGFLAAIWPEEGQYSAEVLPGQKPGLPHPVGAQGESHDECLKRLDLVLRLELGEVEVEWKPWP